MTDRVHSCRQAPTGRHFFVDWPDAEGETQHICCYCGRIRRPDGTFTAPLDLEAAYVRVRGPQTAATNVRLRDYLRGLQSAEPDRALSEVSNA
jgi:hypothetical protein